MCYASDMINYDELEKELQIMKPRQKLFEMVKAEMKKRGHWKGKKRGKGWPKGFDPRAKKPNK